MRITCLPESIAACEVIARLKGNWGARDSYSEGLDAWIEKHPQIPSVELVSLGVAILDRILDDKSELRDLWEESKFYRQWQEAVEELRGRVVA